MLPFIYRFGNATAGALPVQVTDGLPRIGGRTFIAAVVLTLVLAFGLHVVFKFLTIRSAITPEALQGIRGAIHATADADDGLAREIIEASLYFPTPVLHRTNEAPPAPKLSYDQPVPEPQRVRAGLGGLLPDLLATYFSSDVSAVQIYARLLPRCNSTPGTRKTPEAQKQCQSDLLNASYTLAGELKHNGIFILYRLQAGYIQFVALYVFCFALLIFFLRKSRAKDLIYYSTYGSEFRERFSRAYDEELTDLSFREYMFLYWLNKINKDKDNEFASLSEHLNEFRTILYEPGTDADRLDRMKEKAARLRRYHSALTRTVQKDPQELVAMDATRRHREVLPRTILRVITAFVVDQAYFPNVARERASAALEQSVDELAATLTVDRDLYSRCVELVPVIGFFGTVWGLSLAMLGANDVIRAQEPNWTFNIAGNVTYITEAFLAHPSEKQQFALEGMLGALSIKFDTTGYSLVLMFLLIIFGALCSRREDRALSTLHSTVNETTLSVLPTYGGVDVEVPKWEVFKSEAAKAADIRQPNKRDGGAQWLRQLLDIIRNNKAAHVPQPDKGDGGASRKAVKAADVPKPDKWDGSIA
jgi:hypothetical protein